jgi:hypothetical protein
MISAEIQEIMQKIMKILIESMKKRRPKLIIDGENNQAIQLIVLTLKLKLCEILQKKFD